MRIRPAYVKCDAVSGSRTVHHQVGPQGRDGSLYVDVFLKETGRTTYEQTEHPRVSISDYPDPHNNTVRHLTVAVDGKIIYKEMRVAY